MNYTKRPKKSGQTVVEYMLILLVIMVIAYTMAIRIKAYFLADATNCNANSKSLICQFQRIYSDANYRYFVIKK